MFSQDTASGSNFPKIYCAFRICLLRLHLISSTFLFLNSFLICFNFSKIVRWFLHFLINYLAAYFFDIVEQFCSLKETYYEHGIKSYKALNADCSTLQKQSFSTAAFVSDNFADSNRISWHDIFFYLKKEQLSIKKKHIYLRSISLRVGKAKVSSWLTVSCLKINLLKVWSCNFS